MNEQHIGVRLGMRTLCALKNYFHLTKYTSEVLGLLSVSCAHQTSSLMGLPTLENPLAPSSFKMCSRACLARSAATRDLALPNKKDIFVSQTSDNGGEVTVCTLPSLARFATVRMAPGQTYPFIPLKHSIY